MTPPDGVNTRIDTFSYSNCITKNCTEKNIKKHKILPEIKNDEIYIFASRIRHLPVLVRETG